MVFYMLYRSVAFYYIFRCAVRVPAVYPGLYLLCVYLRTPYNRLRPALFFM